MIFQTNKGEIYGYKTRRFQATEPMVQAFSRIPNFLDEDGYTGPIECGGIDKSTSLSIKKAFSESVERRAVTIGAKVVSKHDPLHEQLQHLSFGIEDCEEYSCGFDVINQKPVLIPKAVTTLRTTKPYIVDTTGTAVHSNTEKAHLYAIKELLEKNALFSFWYGLKGRRINRGVSFELTSKLEKMGYELSYYVVDIFAPLLVVILIGYNPHHYTQLKYVFGVGSGINLEEAIIKATTEAYMLRLYYNVLYFRGEHHSNAVSYDNEVIQEPIGEDVETHIERFRNLPTYKGTGICETGETVRRIIDGLPEWVTQLYITVLPQTLKKELIVVKAFSPDLVNHIPKKSFVESNTPIVSKYLRLSETKLNGLPECPII
ncbi:YcaO-like family protein [Pseudalkalibacillus berkeleyi]|uniref:YcaO-like family protein n=1 Tax=Pseudalkalibacillus berkeleyi TaxID=1069813 RepID=A0ABS9GXU1_9BACL|nr:YcaO-like family protein [Pseudalkalibacillus berkeleyi]MCF6136515.1 YcaO-like family protein [Pseudalkalibacillus berkeleyi]